jgi:hypothetical protein
MAQLVEARMHAMPDNATHDYSPSRLRVLFRRYREIAAMLDEDCAIRYTGDVVLGGIGSAHGNVCIKADLDRALLWLRQMDRDPAAAGWIVEHYITGTFTADIAEADGVGQRTVHRRIGQGLRDMAVFLGWRPPLDNGASIV